MAAEDFCERCGHAAHEPGACAVYFLQTVLVPPVDAPAVRVDCPCSPPRLSERGSAPTEGEEP
jgi:hypothetical protein